MLLGDGSVSRGETRVTRGVSHPLKSCINNTLSVGDSEIIFAIRIGTHRPIEIAIVGIAMLSAAFGSRALPTAFFAVDRIGWINSDESTGFGRHYI